MVDATEEDRTPPRVEELPEWFREEIEERRERIQVREDEWRSRESRLERCAFLVCGVAGVLVGRSFSPTGVLGLSLLGLLAGGSGFLVVRREIDRLFSLLLFAIVALCVTFAGHLVGIFDLEDAALQRGIPLAYLQFSLLGFVTGILVEADRSRRLPF